MIEQIAYGLAAAGAAIGTFLAAQRTSKKNGKSAAADVALTVRAAIEDLKTTLTASSEAPIRAAESEDGLIARIEALERRVDGVHKDSLKYLQKAAAAEQRMKQRLEEQEDSEGELTEAQARQLLASQGIVPGDGGPSTTPTRLSRAQIEAEFGSR